MSILKIENKDEINCIDSDDANSIINNSFSQLTSFWSRKYTHLDRQRNLVSTKSNAETSHHNSLNVGNLHEFHEVKSVPSPIQTVRDIPELMIIIHSFLTVSDRIRLGEVDIEFYLDPGRGKIVGVYGDKDLEFDDAWKEIRK